MVESNQPNHNYKLALGEDLYEQATVNFQMFCAEVNDQSVRDPEAINALLLSLGVEIPNPPSVLT